MSMWDKWGQRILAEFVENMLEGPVLPSVTQVQPTKEDDMDGQAMEPMELVEEEGRVIKIDRRYRLGLTVSDLDGAVAAAQDRAFHAGRHSTFVHQKDSVEEAYVAGKVKGEMRGRYDEAAQIESAYGPVIHHLHYAARQLAAAVTTGENGKDGRLSRGDIVTAFEAFQALLGDVINGFNTSGPGSRHTPVAEMDRRPGVSQYGERGDSIPTSQAEPRWLMEWVNARIDGPVDSEVVVDDQPAEPLSF